VFFDSNLGNLLTAPQTNKRKMQAIQMPDSASKEIPKVDPSPRDARYR
jgi:hypothetical protein